MVGGSPHLLPAYFLVGIGGSGMMPLATILAARGHDVAGSDRSLDAQAAAPAAPIRDPKFAALAQLGIALFAQDGSGITADRVVVASAAVEEDVADMVAARALGAARMTRAELLAQSFNASVLPIGVAGTSGKSTVTGMIGWILAATGRRPTVMNGAVMKNFVTPANPFASALVGEGEAFVAEVDESDGSIALYRPGIAVLNNVSLDHKPLDELRRLFGGFIANARTAVINADNVDAAALARSLPSPRVVFFALEGGSAGGRADLVGQDLDHHPFGVDFTLVVADRNALRVALPLPGRHNVANALAAIGATQAAGVAIEDAVAALASFGGLRRRLDHVGTARGVAVIDDFAHNPDKIAATLAALHQFAGRLLILFQPHGFGPLKVMRRELVAAFAAGLSGADLLILSDPVYRGGTVDRAVTSADLVADLAAAGVDARHVADRDAAAAQLVAMANVGDRIVVMGARDDSLSTVAARMVATLTADDIQPDGKQAGRGAGE